MTLIGLVAVLVVLALTLGALTLVNRALRHEAAEARTRHTLLTLQAALHSYAADHDTAPPGDAGEALLTLQAHPSAGEHLASLRFVHWDQDPPHVLDGFGRPLHYQAPDLARRRPASFVSAGRSGQFGLPSPRHTDAPRHADLAPHRRAAADNLYGYELETPNP